MNYYDNIVETEEDIYINSIIHYCKTKYENNDTINYYALDKRFIINLKNLEFYLLDRYSTATVYNNDKYFLIFSVLGSVDFVNKESLFNDLIINNLILSTQSFVLQYNVTPRYRKSY